MVQASSSPHDIDADDERLLSVLENVLNTLELDLAVEVYGPAEVSGVLSTVAGQSDDDWC